MTSRVYKLIHQPDGTRQPVPATYKQQVSAGGWTGIISTSKVGLDQAIQAASIAGVDTNNKDQFKPVFVEGMAFFTPRCASIYLDIPMETISFHLNRQTNNWGYL